MQNVKQTSTLKFVSTYALAMLAMVLLFSCSKSINEIPEPNNGQLTAFNQSSSSQQKNSLVAVPFDRTVFVSCANGGAGEEVALTGSTNFVYQMIWTEQGFSLVYHDNSYGVTGVGLSSGETFVASGGTQGTVAASWVNSQWIATTTEQLRIIGQNTSFIIKYKYHIAITPDGNVTVSRKEETVECE